MLLMFISSFEIEKVERDLTFASHGEDILIFNNFNRLILIMQQNMGPVPGGCGGCFYYYYK